VSCQQAVGCQCPNAAGAGGAPGAQPDACHVVDLLPGDAGPIVLHLCRTTESVIECNLHSYRHLQQFRCVGSELSRPGRTGGAPRRRCRRCWGSRTTTATQPPARAKSPPPAGSLLCRSSSAHQKYCICPFDEMNGIDGTIDGRDESGVLFICTPACVACIQAALGWAAHVDHRQRKTGKSWVWMDSSNKIDHTQSPSAMQISCHARSSYLKRRAWTDRVLNGSACLCVRGRTRSSSSMQLGSRLAHGLRQSRSRLPSSPTSTGKRLQCPSWQKPCA